MRQRKRSVRGNTWKLASEEINLKAVLASNISLLMSKIKPDLLFGPIFMKEMEKRGKRELYDKFVYCSAQLKRKIEGFRLGRLLNETTKKEINMISFGQMRYFLFKALKVVLHGYLLTEEECKMIATTSSCILLANPFNLKEAETALFKIQIRFFDSLPKKCRFSLRKRLITLIFSWLWMLTRKVFVFSKNTFNQNALYRHDEWRRQRLDALKERSAFEVTGETTDRKLHIIPKSGGCRPIVSGFTTAEKENMALIRTVLETLCNSRSSIRVKNFKEFFTKYREFSSKWASAKLYYSTGDISDCFGSVDTTKLNMGLQSILFPEKKFIVAKGQLINSRRRVIYRAGISLAGLQRTMQKLGARVVYTKSISTRFIYDFIQSDTFNLTFTFQKRVFKFKDGLLQGHPLSPILTEFWLLLQERELTCLMSDKILIQRYVDDYFLASTNKLNIVKCLQFLTTKGSLSWDKIKVDFDCNEAKATSKISWCGLDLNHDTGLMSVDSERYYEKTVKYKFLPNSRQATARCEFEKSVKYAVNHYLSVFRKCLAVVPLATQETEVNKFLNFIYNIVFGRYVAKYRLQTKDKKTRKLMKKMIGKVARSLRKDTATAGGIGNNRT
ncbi:unnamed protein product [Bursaphelenchus xylophilus]|uniref:Telomerase reverse transcriptase n=1 Tax=Bursaphelenchus xylophilus TaxID=6326 RepID=A0A7I8XBB9_BURXY|nr:unnamed protein product [Bursaphelenchus xylophilus]CAG9084128.1 unnamed protein product [Bursaphelenchus xylophilus]